MVRPSAPSVFPSMSNWDIPNDAGIGPRRQHVRNRSDARLLMNGNTAMRGPEVARRRREKGWAQEKLAEKAGCGVKTIQRAENGHALQLRIIGEIAQALGCCTSDLIIDPDRQVAAPRAGIVPAPPRLFIGRDEAMCDLKARLIVKSTQETPATQILTAVRGWPGVGKTTLAAALAHDAEIWSAFPDGILWTSLGQSPNLLTELAAWGYAVGSPEIEHYKTIETASRHLAALLSDKRFLLIVDDAWAAEHAVPFRVGGRGCAMLITTRLATVADSLGTPSQVYRLGVLADSVAVELLEILAPTVVARDYPAALELARTLEGLPLALHVAGRLLDVETRRGLGTGDLLAELRADTARILSASAPADMADLVSMTTPTIAALLQKSSSLLTPETRDRYAYLGAFAPKPATFDLAAMAAVWGGSDPRPTIQALLDRGLLEAVEPGRFQMHALLVTHAKSLLAG